MSLETERLQLRPLVDDDVVALSRLFADRRVTEHLALDGLNAGGAQGFAEEFVNLSQLEFQRHQTGAQAIEPQGGNSAIGYTGLRPLPDRTSAFELLYALHPKFWGRGLATEAGQAVLDWGFRDLLDMTEAIALIRSGNKASIRVAEKLGLEYHGPTDHYYGEILEMYAIYREDFR